MSTLFLENSSQTPLTPIAVTVAIRRMSSFGKALKRLREAKFMTQEQLAAAAAVSAKSISTWEGLAGPTIQGTKYAMLAKALGLTTSELDREWRSQKIDQTIGDPVRRGIPVINKAPAGGVVDYHECSMADSGQGHWYVGRDNIADPHAFAVVITGDSMEPYLHEGCTAIFSPMDSEGFIQHPRMQIPQGRVVFVRFGAEAENEGCCVARWYWKGKGEGKKIQLVKDNKKYKPKVYAPAAIVQMAAMIIHDEFPGVRKFFDANGQLENKGEKDKQVEGKLHHDPMVDPASEFESQVHPNYD